MYMSAGVQIDKNKETCTDRDLLGHIHFNTVTNLNSKSVNKFSLLFANKGGREKKSLYSTMI